MLGHIQRRDGVSEGEGKSYYIKLECEMHVNNTEG